MTTTSAVLTGIPGVRESVVGDLRGELPLPESAQSAAEMQLAVASTVARELASISELLGLGSVEVVSITGTQPAWVIAFRLQSLIVAEVDRDHSVRKVEHALKETDWLAATEWVLSDSDIEYIPSSKPNPEESGKQGLPVRGNGLT